MKGVGREVDSAAQDEGGKETSDLWVASESIRGGERRHTRPRVILNKERRWSS